MEIRVLRYFLAIAHEGSITAASRELHVSQPALSKQMGELEGELGKQLLVREPRGVSLTEDGMLLRRRAQEIVELAEKTEAEISADDETVAGDVAIGCGETQGMHYLARAANTVRRRYPDVHFNLFSGNGEDVAERLDKGLVDFGLFVGLGGMDRFEHVGLPSHDVWGLLVRSDHPLARHEHVRAADLEGVELTCSRQALERNDLSDWLGCPIDELDIIGTYNLIYNAAIMVEECGGCAFCLEGLVDIPIDGNLRFVPFAPRVETRLSVAWKRYVPLSKAANVFLETLRQTIEQDVAFE